MTKQTVALLDVSECDDVDLLLAELRQCHSDWLVSISRMAQIVKRLDELGVEVAIENSMLPFIRLIAHGQLSAALFETCAGDIQLLERARQLPLPVQETIARNEPMKVMSVGGDHRMVRPLDMTNHERRQVFAGKRLRTDAEQIGFLNERFAPKGKDAPKPPPVSVNMRRRCLVVTGPCEIPLADLAGYVSSMSRK